VTWYCLSFHGFVCFHFLHAEFLEESFVMLAWWSYIVLISAYHGEALYGLGMQGVKVLILLGAFYLPRVAPVSQKDF
jgi:hypothetical protein